MHDEAEISLREIIEVLLKFKGLIALVTASAVLAASIAVFWVIEPKYEAEAKLIVADFKPSTEAISTDLVGGLPIYPDFTIDSYREQLKNPEVMEKVLAELNLSELGYTVSSLSRAVSVEAIRGTNLIKIKVRDGSPELAAQIANALALNFTEFITTLTQEQASKTLALLEEALLIQDANLNAAQLAYSNFLKQPNGVAELGSEISSKISQITSFKSILAQLEIDIAVETAAQLSTQAQLAQTERYLYTTKTIVDDPVLYNLVQGQETTGGTALLEVKSQEHNPLYLSLQAGLSTRVTTLARLRAQNKDTIARLTQLQVRLETLQVDLADKTYQAELLQRNVAVAQKSFNTYIDRREEVRIAQSAKLGEAAVVISSRAVAPIVPVSPKKLLTLVVAAFAGMMIGVFSAFLKGYWDATTPAGRSRPVVG